MLENNDADFACPICEGVTKHYLPVENWGEMRRCLSCGFVFANPMSLPESPESLFGRAYGGEETRTGMTDFSNRLLFFTEDLKRVNINFEKILLGAAREAIDFLKVNVPIGAVIFDIGCGTGIFLNAIRRIGYKSVGLDVGKPAVEKLRSEGYQVWHGTIDTVPAGWVDPDVVTSFFMLHHLSDPVGFLKTIRVKFPKAILLVGEHNGLEWSSINLRDSIPPRTLSWWGVQPLRLAAQRAGYSVEIVVPQKPISEYGINALTKPYFALSRVLPFRLSPLLAVYYKIKPLIFWPLVVFGLTRGVRSSGILAIGYPR